MPDSQEQSGGDSSVNIQAAGNVQLGLTYEEVRQAALDVFDANFHKLSLAAADIARSRAEHLVEEYLNRLQADAPEALSEMADPDMQYVLYTAQREYARQGDEDLGDLLVQLLVDPGTEVRARTSTDRLERVPGGGRQTYARST